MFLGGITVVDVNNRWMNLSGGHQKRIVYEGCFLKTQEISKLEELKEKSFRSLPEGKTEDREEIMKVDVRIFHLIQT